MQWHFCGHAERPQLADTFPSPLMSYQPGTGTTCRAHDPMLLTFSNILELEHSSPLHPTDNLPSSFSSLQHTPVQTYIPGWKLCIYPGNTSTFMTGSLLTLHGELYVFFVPLFLRVNSFIQALQTSLLFPAHLLAQLVVWHRAVALSAWKGQPPGTRLHLPLGRMGVVSVYLLLGRRVSRDKCTSSGCVDYLGLISFAPSSYCQGKTACCSSVFLGLRN